MWASDARRGAESVFFCFKGADRKCEWTKSHDMGRLYVVAEHGLPAAFSGSQTHRCGKLSADFGPSQGVMD